MSPRRKRSLLIALCLIAAALLAPPLVRIISSAREPHYAGQPLSFWVATFTQDRIEDAELQRATNAIAHIGVAGLPYLLKWLQYEDPPWRVKLASWLSRTPLPLASELSDWITDPRPQEMASAATFSFVALGKTAMPVLHDLCQLMNDSNSQYVAHRAAAALGRLGTNALPPLLVVIANPQHPARLAALQAVGTIPDIGDEAQTAVTAVANCLSPTNTQTTQIIAINTLRNLNVCPQICTPALAACLESPNIFVRVRSAEALCDLGHQASNAIPALVRAMEDADTGVRVRATNALLRIAPGLLRNLTPQ